jgi:hypothetical protein
MFDKAPKKPVRGDYDRRWLSDDFFDLIIWYRPDDTIHGFQLCYDKPYWERALTWMSDRGFSHMEVDSGEQVYPPNQTPILVPDGSFPADKVFHEFTRRGSALPLEVRQLVTDKISEFVQRKV